jgi:hypothetical protein
VVERESEQFVTINLNETADAPSTGEVRLFFPEDPDTTISTFPSAGTFTGKGAAYSRSSGRTLEIPAGRAIQFEFAEGGVKKLSPVYSP